MSQQFPPAQPPSSAPGGAFGDAHNPYQAPPAAPDGAWPTVDVTATEPPKRHRGRTVAVVAASAVAVAALLGGGAYGLAGLNGGGEGPEQRIPANAVAYAEVDLNPSLEQKLDALRFVLKLPDVDRKAIREDSDLREVIYDALTEDLTGAPPWSRAKDWVGDRAAIAALPGTGDEPFEPVALIAVTDDGKAREDLAGVADDDGVFAVRDGWAVLARTGALAERVAATAEGQSLSGSSTFRQDLDRLGDSGIVSAWFDGRAVASVAKSFAGPGADSTEGLLPGALESLEQVRDQLGHGAATLRFDGPQLELAVVTVGTKIAKVPNGTGIEKLPADSLVAVSSQGLGQQLTEAWPTLSEQGGDALADETGLAMPQDLAALLGERTHIVLSKGGSGDTPDFGIRVSSRDSGRLPRALDAVTELTEGLFPLQRKDLPGGYVLASSPKQAAALSRDDGGLGSAEGFKDVLPDVGSAQTAAFVDLAGLADLGGTSAEDAKVLKALGAAGLTGAVDGDGVTRITLRVGTR